MCNDGLVSRIQRFSLDDGPGIRTTVFMQGCNMRCPWCHNPEAIPSEGALLLYEKLCTACGACRMACPEQIIKSCRISDRRKCTLCGKCQAVCPNNAIIISGEKMSADSAFDYIAQDMPYYIKSGGGVTISGGEPLLQADFCAALAEKCYSSGINVIIDTAGSVPFRAFEKLLGFVDCFYFDIKTVPTDYSKIGADGELVFKNLKRLSDLCRVVVRMPIIPGFNSDKIEAIAEKLSVINVKEMHPLPFHRLAVGKYKALGTEYAFAKIKPYKDIERIKEMFTMKKAKAAVLTAVNHPFEIREYPIGEPPGGYARLKLKASGVCGTDVHIQTGKLGLTANQIIGHEFIGEIEAIAPEDTKRSGFSIGDSAIVCIACPCGVCLLCKNGDDANCVNMQVTNGKKPDVSPHFHGGYAEYSFAPVENLITLPKELDPVMASVFACPGPTALHAFSLAVKAGVDISRINTAVVQGTGPVGCFAILYLKTLGIKNIIAIGGGKNSRKDTHVKKLGATEILHTRENSEAEIIEKTKSISGGQGADLVFEASGRPEAVPLGITLLRNRGVYLIPGQYSNSGGIEIQPQLITFKALQIIGSSQYSKSDVIDYVNFLENNPQLHEKIKAIATCYSVESINLAFDDAKARKNIKTVLVP